MRAKRTEVNGPSEERIQAAFFQWIGLYSASHPALKLFYAIPNGSYKGPAARGMFKRTGLRAGVPDCHLPIAVYKEGEKFDGLRITPGHHYAGLWIEFKSKRGVWTEQQIVWAKNLRDAGHRVEVCRSWTGAANIVIEYLNLPITKL